MNYHSTFEMKSFSEPALRRLADCQEARDLLTRTFFKDGLCIAVFRFGAVALPEEMGPKLAALVGKTVSILRLDNTFHVREA